MFTGIVQRLAKVTSADRQANLLQLVVDLSGMTQDLENGASVAINGVCLTVVDTSEGQVRFDVIPESQSRTNIGTVEAGDHVNVERSFAVGDEIGGHVVSGHVSGTAEIIERRVDHHDHVISFRADGDWMKYVFNKGFIALDGASLTVSALDRDAGVFEISLIPETLDRTTLGEAAVGERVNVEVDAQTVASVETVERVLSDPQWRAQFRETLSV